MTLHYKIIILIFLTLTSIYGQTDTILCKCPETDYGEVPNVTFNLSNGKTIILCGYIDDIKPTIFSEFFLAVCGQDEIIDFRPYNSNFQLKVNKDTLLVDELIRLPTGKKFEFKQIAWSTEKLYFMEQKIVRKLVINKKLIRKYDQNEIRLVLKHFEKFRSNNGHLFENEVFEDLPAKLFIATISGSKKARQYFEEFPKIGGFDGALSYYYGELSAMLRQWDEKKD